MKSLIRNSVFALLVLGMVAFVSAQEHTIRMQTHFSAESPSGKQALQFIDDVQTMSGGRVEIEMFFSSAVVDSVETFQAAADGILDADMTGGSYQTGKNPAFQFAGDLMGGYDDPWQQYTWLETGGRALVEDLYEPFGMHFLGWWIPGHESMSSSRPLRGPEDLVDWKFRSPPGMETDIFAELGAKPIVMDFTEIFTALETGIIDGADAANLVTNDSLGLYDLVEHATYPGFHSMPADHLAINSEVWDGLPEDIQRIFEVAMQKLAYQTSIQIGYSNAKAATEYAANGLNLYDWSDEDRLAYRQGAQAAWEDWGTRTEEAKPLYESHIAFMKEVGILK